MTAEFEYEKRQFIRLPLAVPVRYKFLSREMSAEGLGAIHEGVSQNLGAGGLPEKGDLSGKGFEVVNGLLTFVDVAPLFTMAELLAGSLVFHDDQGDMVSCASISAIPTVAVATFPTSSGFPDGTITFSGMANDPLQIVSAVTDADGLEWHVHEGTVPNGSAQVEACDAVAGPALLDG